MDIEKAKEYLLKYSDWYLYMDKKEKSFACDPLADKKIINTEDSKAVSILSKKLISECMKHDGLVDFTLEYLGSPFRCHRINSYDGTMIQLRRFPSVNPDIKKLGLPDRFISTAMSDKLHSGLVLIGGSHGNGKSTTLAAFVASRLRIFGGIGLTIEDPIEFPLQGKHGNGFCIQTNAASDSVDSGKSAFAEAVKGAMRSYPVSQNGVLMLGEIRDSETAAEACRASVNGLLVCCSIHANSPYDILHRIESLASRAIDVEEVRALLSTGFRMLAHQQLKKGKMSCMTLTTNQSVAAKLAEGKYKNLSTEIEKENGLLRRI